MKQGKKNQVKQTAKFTALHLGVGAYDAYVIIWSSVILDTPALPTLLHTAVLSYFGLSLLSACSFPCQTLKLLSFIAVEIPTASTH